MPAARIAAASHGASPRRACEFEESAQQFRARSRAAQRERRDRGTDLAPPRAWSTKLRGILWQSIVRTYEDDALQLCAAIAYYSLLSMAPLLLIAVAVAGVFFADGAVHAQLIAQMEKLVGAEGAALTKTVIESTQSEERSRWSLLVGAVLTLTRRHHGVRAAAKRAEPRVARRGRARQRAARLHQAPASCRSRSCSASGSC